MSKNILDKSQWPDGPWHQEPDYEEFIYKDVLCVLNRGLFGSWNGYIAIPKDNPWASREKSYESEELEVHGGVTYSDDYPPYLHDNYEKNKALNLFWIGFDCAHAFDIIPARKIEIGELFKDNKYYFAREKYWTIDDVRNELKQLADQIDQKK